MVMGSTKGNNRKTLGELLNLWTACGVLVVATGQWSEVREETGETEREKRRYRDREGGKGGKSEQRSSLCSLNEVFFLLFCVCMVALSVDDGCVGVGRVVRPFGFVCQVCS